MEYPTGPPLTAGLLHERMQSLALNNNNGDSKLFHYCYVCNTQLNSCKQALLHCSGKRHRKKLQFLQSRKTTVGQHQQIGTKQLVNSNSTMPPQSTVPLGNTDEPNQGFYPIVNPYHGMTPIIPYATEAPLLLSHPTPQFYPTIINAHHVGQNVDPWLAQTNMIPYHHMQAVPHLLPQLQKKFVSAYSGSSTSSPMGLTDVSVNSSSSYSAHSAVISPSETSSISSECVPVKLYTCRDCDRQFSNRVQLYVHLQNMQHCKASLQTHHKHSEAKKSVGDLSETDSWSSSASIYFCTVCNVGLNSQTQLDSHNAGQKHKQRCLAQRKQCRSSSASSEPPERIMDSGYVSSSGDEVICISQPTPDKPTAKFRCQLCDLILNSPAQAKQHLRSQKHLMHLNANKAFSRASVRRKSSLKKNLIVHQLDNLQSTYETGYRHIDHAHSDNCDSNSTASADHDPNGSLICGAHSL